MTVKHLMAAAFAFSLGLSLGACSSFSDFVSDHWPHFAGGEPDSVPPRPGTPGYAAFAAHGQSTDSADSIAGGGQAATPGVTSSVAEQRPAGDAQQGPRTTVAPAEQSPGDHAQTPITTASPPGAADHDIAQGGLY